MKEEFASSISAIAASPVHHDIVALGFFDGLIKCCRFGRSEIGKLAFIESWSHRLKKGVRDFAFSDDGENLYVISENRALAIFNVGEGRLLRCIKRSHAKTRPHRITSLPEISRYCAATGGDNGEICQWDFNSAEAMVVTYKDQTASINDLAPFKATTLLAASGDAKLASYDFRRRKLRVLSETMHTELLSIAILDKCTCVGSGDGTLEIFNNGEFGNIIGRFKTSHAMGVDAMIELEPHILLTGGCMSDEIEFCKIQPNEKLRTMAHAGGADIFARTCDDKYLIISCTDTNAVYVRRVADLARTARQKTHANNGNNAIFTFD